MFQPRNSNKVTELKGKTHQVIISKSVQRNAKITHYKAIPQDNLNKVLVMTFNSHKLMAR